MTDKQITLNKLEAFKNRDKFSDFEWRKRGLNPSESEISSRLQILFNDCTENLIDAVNSNSKPRLLKIILKNWLNSLNSSHYDTEEREFICDYFDQLSKIISIDFKDNLNGWLYGRIFNTLFKITSFLKGQDKIIEKLSQDCSQCNDPLETLILKKEEGIPDYSWTIIQCNNCNQFNLLSIGPNVKEHRYGNYKLIEELLKTEYTEEQANTRLEQIKFFRKKSY